MKTFHSSAEGLANLGLLPVVNSGFSPLGLVLHLTL